MSTDTPKELIARAHKVVNDLCNGRIRWTMSVPAREHEDPDLVIGAALRAAEFLLAENEELRRALGDARYQLESGRVWSGDRWSLPTGYNAQKALNIIASPTNTETE